MEFITSRGYELPETESEMAREGWFNMWSSKLWPYEELVPGALLYWYESPSKSIVWKTRVEDVDRFEYASKDTAAQRIEKRFGLVDKAQSYYVDAPARGFCLAYKVTPVQRLALPKPERFRFPHQGWLRVDDEVTGKWLSPASTSGKSTLRGKIKFEVGKVYDRRKDIHAVFGGQARGGIATPKNVPVIFLFTGEEGLRFGYEDKWTDDGTYLYAGEGRVGDMQFERGNRAIRDHAADGKDLLPFESLGGGSRYRYLGQFGCSSWETKTGRDRRGRPRKLIVFHFVPEPLEEETTSTAKPAHPISLDELRRRALEAASGASEQSPREGRRSYYERSEAVKAYVLARANGTCEACRKPAPFIRPDGSAYLEPHHIRRISDRGPDDPRWVGAVCPNCHKEIEYGVKGAELNEKLLNFVAQLERH